MKRPAKNKPKKKKLPEKKKKPIIPVNSNKLKDEKFRDTKDILEQSFENVDLSEVGEEND